MPDETEEYPEAPPTTSDTSTYIPFGEVVEHKNDDWVDPDHRSYSGDTDDSGLHKYHETDRNDDNH